MVNKVILIGNLGQDPEEPRKTGSGSSVLDISIATSRKGRNGETETEWHTVTCWNRTAEIVHQYLKAGSKVYVEGRLQYDSWQDKDTGKTRKKAKIVATTVQFLSGKGDVPSDSFAPKQKKESFSSQNNSNDYGNVDDLPF